MLLERSLLGRGAPEHVAAVLRPLRPAVVRILKLALVPTRLVSPGALGPAGLIGRRRLPAGIVGVLGEGRPRLARGVRGPLGLRCVLPYAGVARLQRQRGGGAAGRQSSFGA